MTVQKVESLFDYNDNCGSIFCLLTFSQKISESDVEGLDVSCRQTATAVAAVSVDELKKMSEGRESEKVRRLFRIMNRNVYLDPWQLIDLKIGFESSDCYVCSLISSKRWGLLEVANNLSIRAISDHNPNI
ncbi:hypothetical protein M9H77_01963 [Catharanthus roseus]|uniref:Uncharacterized protein n=1 Tax=Catharanthus roseus TaxID=4058 RepID=A0ACC0C740_CATRO|nr:hypothetical protein M9H77_01963 [Catharanthus roseus]